MKIVPVTYRQKLLTKSMYRQMHCKIIFIHKTKNPENGKLQNIITTLRYTRINIKNFNEKNIKRYPKIYPFFPLDMVSRTEQGVE